MRKEKSFVATRGAFETSLSINEKSDEPERKYWANVATAALKKLSDSRSISNSWSAGAEIYVLDGQAKLLTEFVDDLDKVVGLRLENDNATILSFRFPNDRKRLDHAYQMEIEDVNLVDSVVADEKMPASGIVLSRAALARPVIVRLLFADGTTSLDAATLFVAKEVVAGAELPVSLPVVK